MSAGVRRGTGAGRRTNGPDSGTTSCGSWSKRPAEFRVSRIASGRVDACFFCLGVPSAGMSEADYPRVTYDLTLHRADAAG